MCFSLTYCRYKPSDCVDPACDNDATFCPGYKICEPIPYEKYNTIETICISYFTWDYLMRMFTVAFVPAV